MKKKRLLISSMMLVLVLFAVAMLLPAFAKPVWAAEGEGDKTPKAEYLSDNAKDGGTSEDEDGEGTGVHKDPAVFQKNFDLTPAQKEYTVTEIEKVVSEIIDPDMSDLEKYYTLAIWANKRVTYDWDLWRGRYYLEFYSHQWDAYGCMKEGEKSVCAGIAVFYSNLCHAADLPCRIVRADPNELDHTINYLPDINGNAYYVDVTENMFLMSDASNPYTLDKPFSNITKDATEATFSYREQDAAEEAPLNVTAIKDWYDKPFEEWFRQFALHEDTDKIFPVDYVEKGSGLRSTEAGYHHASYQDDMTNYGDTPGIWFLDDFYAKPGEVQEGEVISRILNREFDEKLLNVSGVKKNYDGDAAKLASAVAEDISISYFPTSENGKIVAKSAALTRGVDYVVKCTGYDAQTKTATITIKGIEDYSGEYEISVKVNAAAAEQAPVYQKGLVYNGKAQKLVTAGEAVHGEMQYALGDAKGATETFTAAIPTAVKAGKYYVWYQVVGEEGYGNTQPQLVATVGTIEKAKNPIAIKAKTATIQYKKLKKKAQTLKVSKVLKISKPKGELTYGLISVKKGKKHCEQQFTVNDETGKVTVKKGLKKGTYKVKVYVVAEGNDNYEASSGKNVTFKVKIK